MVVEMNGSLVTARRLHPSHQLITRNSSFFKLFKRQDLSEDIPDDPIVAEQSAQAEEPPSAEDLGQGEAYKATEGTDNSVTATPAAMFEQNQTEPSRKVGRPTAAESIKIRKVREAQLAAKVEANPPTRVSARLKGLDSQSNLLFERRVEILCRDQCADKLE